MSRFEGTWHYARQMAEGMMPVLRDMATITVKDDEHGNPETVKIELSNPNSPFLELSVDEKTDSDIAFSRNTEEESPIRGRLVILS
ncbi:MAG TPA: hypothetical protein VMW27_18100, partial [Thermoanaerobaculia bacterium]|nr:hypothetical protein [Thermoanaerobaculia bacterium]